MNNEILHELIVRLDPEAKGENGVWQFQVEGTKFLCMTDERADRMRVMAPIVEVEKATEEQILECMKANFDRALDARYCINQGVVWSAFIHPLGSLTPDLFFSAVSQVGTARATFGTDYSSGHLLFRGGEKSQEEEKKAEDREKPLS